MLKEEESEAGDNQEIECIGRPVRLDKEKDEKKKEEPPKSWKTNKSEGEDPDKNGLADQFPNYFG